MIIWSTITTASPSTLSTIWAGWGGRCRASQRQDLGRRRDGAQSRTRLCCRPVPARRMRPAFASISSQRPSTTMPILGVCLGHQAIGQAFGGKVVRAPTPVHGKVSEISHQGTGVFRGINGSFKATRYHSLVVERASMPRRASVTAETDDRLVMGLMHQTAAGAWRAIPSRKHRLRTRSSDAANFLELAAHGTLGAARRAESA